MQELLYDRGVSIKLIGISSMSQSLVLNEKVDIKNVS